MSIARAFPAGLMVLVLLGHQVSLLAAPEGGKPAATAPKPTASPPSTASAPSSAAPTGTSASDPEAPSEPDATPESPPAEVPSTDVHPNDGVPTTVLPDPAANGQAPPSSTAPTDTSPARIDAELVAVCSDLDAVLREAARDLSLDVALQIPCAPAAADEELLLEAAADGWALAIQLVRGEDGVLLRLSAVRPQSQTILVSRVQVSESDLEMRSVQLLRDVSRHGVERATPTKPIAPVRRPAVRRSPGRAVLTAHGALVGGYVGFSLEHIGGAGDARLVYPLMTLGAGAGVGASLIIAEEWDVSVAEAWYVWAAGTWSAVSGMLIADAADSQTDSRRYGYGLLGTSLGLTLGAVSLNTGEVGTGGALFTHSGALFGAYFGGIGEMLVEGDTGISPMLGMGIGMGSGLLVTGGLAPHLGGVSSSRVLLVDVSALLGGLAGAAVASPIVVGEDLTEDESRLWLGSIAAGTVLGGAIGLLLTNDDEKDTAFQSGARFLPFAGFAPAHGRLPPAGIAGIAGAF